MKAIQRIALIYILLVIASGCQQDYNNEIESELQVHFYNFEEEARVHGLDISLNNLEIGGYIQDIEERGTIGQCKSYSNGYKQIVIDQSYWNRLNDMEREYVVFHELGHCLLNREHEDNKDEYGVCTSIMQSGDGACSALYNLENREVLLAELFKN